MNTPTCITVGIALFASVVLACAPVRAQEAEAVSSVGAMPIRFYSGNLSVGRFMHYWGTAQSDAVGLLDQATTDTLLRTGCTAMCDYPAWCVIEREEGAWDFGFLQENARRLREAGLDYNVFCWLHFPPKWYQASDRFVPYENLETGETIEQLSLWSPDLPRVFDTFYGKLAEAMGDEIAFLRVAMPSEYGEIGYCSGMTNWLRPQPHAKVGYWCGDPYARADFREKMLARHGSLEALNAAWGTDFPREEDVAMPDPKAIEARFKTSPRDRVRWLDFLDWYNAAWVDCLDTVTGIIRRHFPGKELIYSLGYGSERAAYGNDQGRYVEAMARLGVAAQTPGNVGYIATRRVSTACRHYGAPYFTEPPADVQRDAQLNRIFMDLSNGVECWFDYLPNLDRAKDYFVRYKAHFTGADPVTTVAVWHPTADHGLHPGDDWSGPTVMLSEPLRDLMPYEILDDRLILDGALDTLGIRHLVLAGARWLDPAAWDAVHAWVARGGALVVLQAAAMESVDGTRTLWSPEPVDAPGGGAYLSARRAEAGLPAVYQVEPCALDADGYTSGTWYQREPNGFRWARPGAGFILPLKEHARYRVTLEAGLPEKAAPVTVEAGGRAVATLTPPHGGGTSFEVDSGDTTQLELRFTGTGWVPEEAGAGPDTRRLGLYVRRVIVADLDAPEGTPPASLGVTDLAVDVEALWRDAGRCVGQGAVAWVDTAGLTPMRQAVLAAELLMRADAAPGDGLQGAARIDGRLDGVLATAFADKVLYFNATEEPRTVRTAGADIALPLPPRTIVAVP